MNRLLFSIAAMFGALMPRFFDSALKGAALLAVAAVAALVLCRASAAMRHLVWVVAAIAFPLAMVRAAEEKWPPPAAAHVGGNDFSTYSVHDGKHAAFILAYQGDFASMSSGGSNSKTRTWTNSGELTAKKPGIVFSFHRVHTGPDKLTLTAAPAGARDLSKPAPPPRDFGQKEYDPAKGRIFVLSDNGGIRQLDIAAPRVTDHESVEKLAQIIAAVPPVELRYPTLKPKQKNARALYEIWHRHARGNGDIPGALIGELAGGARRFIRFNPAWETVPQLNALLPRLDASRDWAAADVIALLDEVAAIKDSPLGMVLGDENDRTIVRGQPLPKELAVAMGLWGWHDWNGLRVAWELQPRRNLQIEHAKHVGISSTVAPGEALRARLFVHNSGKMPIVVRVPTFLQCEVKAGDVEGKAVECVGINWTTLSRVYTCRLAPGEYVEINTPGIGFGPDAGRGPWAGPRVGWNVLAPPGGSVRLEHAPVPLDGSESGRREDAPFADGPDWWPAAIKARLARELPLPADPTERTRLLDRAANDLFGAPPTAEEREAFTKVTDDNALAAFAARLAQRPGLLSFFGKLKPVATGFKIAANDPQAANVPRVVLGPGEYPLPSASVRRGDATLKIVGRQVGDRRTNDAQLLFEATEATGKARPNPHQFEVPDGWGTWAIVCRPRDGFFYLLHQGGVRKLDYSSPGHVTDTPATDLPVEFRDEVKRQLEAAGVSAETQAEVFGTPAPPATKPEPKSAATLSPAIEAQLDWGEPVNGLRGALVIRSAAPGAEPGIYFAVQNVSDKPLHFADTTGAKDLRKLYLSDSAGILMAITSSEATQTDVELPPRAVEFLRQFGPVASGQKSVEPNMIEGIRKDSLQTWRAVLLIQNAPEGAWRGKLITGETRCAVTEGPQPRNQAAQALYKIWQDRARLNGDIPGGLVRLLHDQVKEFIRNNEPDAAGAPYAAKIKPLQPRFGELRDWKPVEVVALLDDIAAAHTLPLDTTMKHLARRRLLRGQPLPTALEKADWGQPLKSGLRMAHLLEPRAEAYPLGTQVKARILLHNTGKEPVAFITSGFHQSSHKAKLADGSELKLDATDWLTLGQPQAWRLAPGEFIEASTPGLGIGAREKDRAEWSDVRAGSWILCGDSDEVTFLPGAVMLAPDENLHDPDWWRAFIAERLAWEMPVPRDTKEREYLLYRVVRELFGTAPSTTQGDALAADKSPEALGNLAALLLKHPYGTRSEGLIRAGKTTFRVLPADRDAAKRVRVANNDGWYNLSDSLKFSVSRRLQGNRVINEASLIHFQRGKDNAITKVELPDGYNTWAAAQEPGTTVFWVTQKGLLRKFEFSDPARVEETRYEGDPSTTAPIPADVRKALSAALAAPEAPKQIQPVQPQASTAPASEAPKPKHKDARELYQIWQLHARRNGEIPGAMFGELAAAVKTFIGYNPTWETVPKLNELLPRLGATHDWKPADAISLLDEVAAVKDSPLGMAMRRGTRHTIRRGQALPKKFADASWGDAQNGLRAAWVLEPGTAEHRIGTALRARLLVHNSGPVAVMVQVPTFCQGGVKATDANGAKVEVSSSYWTTLATLAPVRLGPDEYIEISTPGIGLGPRAGMGPWAGPRVGSSVLTQAGDALTLTYGLLPLDGSEVGVSEDDPHVSGPGWWLAHIRARLNRELPRPADAAERTHLLDRLVRGLFATAPYAEEIAAFIADKTPDALDALSKRLAARVDLVSFSGKLPTSEAKFRVLAAEANADQQPRVALGPGVYPLPSTTAKRGDATLKIVARPVGDRSPNDAQLLFEATEATGALAPAPHALKVPDGWGTWASVCRPTDGFLYLLHKGVVRKIDYSSPWNVTDTPATDLPDGFRDEVKHQLEAAGVSSEMQAELFAKPSPPATTPEPKTGATSPAKYAGAKLPDSAYARSGVSLVEQSWPMPLWGAEKEGLSAGLHTIGEARIGGEVRAELWVRNSSAKDVKLLQCLRADVGLHVVAKDKDGKEHSADITSFRGRPVFHHLLLPPGHGVKVKEFSLKFGARKNDKLEAGWVNLQLPPGDYKLRAVWSDTTSMAAREGEWTGKIASGEAQLHLAAADAGKPVAKQAEVGPRAEKASLQPKHEYAQKLFRKWQAGARTDGRIPGGLIGHVAREVDGYLKQYPADEKTPQLAALRPRLDASRDWTQAEIVALLDDITAISTAPVSWADFPMEIDQARAVQSGKPLPKQLESAAWGRAAENGLRAAWLLEPAPAATGSNLTEVLYPLGSVLKARVLFQNAGTTSVVFKTETWHQADGHTARNAKGAEIPVKATWFTGITPMATFRLAPGEYCEVMGHGIAIGAGEYKEERSTGAVGAIIEAKEGDAVTLSHEVDTSHGGWTRPGDPNDPVEFWKMTIAERVANESPMPASAADREQLIRRVTVEIFGVVPTAEEIAAFTADEAPDALAKLTALLQAKQRIEPFSGKLPTGETKFRVIAADPNAAKAPRTATAPGRYVLGAEKPKGAAAKLPDSAYSKVGIPYAELDKRVEWTGTLKSGEVDVKLVATAAPRTAGAKAEAPKADTTPAFLEPGVMPKRSHLFDDRHSAIAVQSEKGVNFVLIYPGALSSGITESSSEASGKWGFEGTVRLLDGEKTKAAGRNVDKRVFAVKYTSDAPATLFLDGKAYDLAAPPRTTSMGALEAAPGRVFLLRDEGEPFQTRRTLALRSEKDLAIIGSFAVHEHLHAGIYAESRRVQQMEGWVLALDAQVPLRHSGGERSARLRIFPDGRVLSLPDGRKLSELKISEGELAEFLRWLVEDQKVAAVKPRAAQPGGLKPGIAHEFDTWAGGVSYFQFRYNSELHSITVGSHLRNPGTGKELANPGAAAHDPIFERLAELERKAVPAPVQARADNADAKPEQR